MAENIQAFDAIVLGEGIAGFAAALALREKGKRVAVVSRATGATSLSSGAWDFGPIPMQGGSLASLSRSPAWVSTFSPVLCEAVLPPSAEEWTESFAAVTGALGDELPIACRFETPYLLPSLSGGLRRVFAAQSSQVQADLVQARGNRFAVVSSRRWRFRADLLSRQWNERAKAAGLTTEFRAVDLPWEGQGGDIPLTRVAADLHAPAVLDTFLEALARLSDSVDALILPPIFPSFAAFERARAAIRFPLAEALAHAEPTPGFRLWRAIQKSLDRLEVTRFTVKQLQVQAAGGRVRDLTALFPGDSGWATLRADYFVLATGRFLAGGLSASYHRLDEPVFALPLYQEKGEPHIADRRAIVEAKASWDKVGVRVDSAYRPLAEDGKPAFQNLVACGSVLGGLDYATQQVGLGFFALTGRHCVASAV